MPVLVLHAGAANRFRVVAKPAGVDAGGQSRPRSVSSCWRVFRALDLEPMLEAEAFLCALLEHRKVETGEGIPAFEMLSEEHMRVFLEYAVPLYREHRDACAGALKWHQVRSGKHMLAAEKEDHAALGQLKEIRRRLRELEDEAALLRKEAELLEAGLQARIGAATGIKGVATWESRETLRRFAAEVLKQNEPRVHEELLGRFVALDHKAWRLREPALYREVSSRYTLLDTAAWRAGDRQLYEEMRARYFTSMMRRRFVALGC